MALEPGDRGIEVERLKQQLEKLGYSIGRIDAEFNDRTEQAVRAFQEEAGLTVDGVVGPRTSEAIERAAAGITGLQLRPTDSPPEVNPAGDFIEGNWPDWTVIAKGELNARSGPGFEFPVEVRLPEQAAIDIHPDYTNPIQFDRIGKPWLVINIRGAAFFVRANNKFIEPNFAS